MPSHTILLDPEKLDSICLQAEALGASRWPPIPLLLRPDALCVVSLPTGFTLATSSELSPTFPGIPCQGMPVTLRLHVRRFFCDERSYKRNIFAERLPGLVGHYARRTNRLDGWLTHVSFALGGEAGARLLEELGVKVSGDTLLKHIRSFTFKGTTTPKILSVDDFSFRRGCRWGTVLVDLERHRLVDILADRSSETFARWLGEHAAGVQIVSRDRSGEYAEAIRKAAPGAIRVADRFHLLKNLGDLVLWVFQRRSESLQSIAAPGPHELTFKGGLPASTCRSRAVAPAPGAPEDPGRYRRQRCLRMSR